MSWRDEDPCLVNLEHSGNVYCGDGSVHGWFELSYANYLTIPRSVLEAMPHEWQAKFCDLLDEMNATLDWGSMLPEPGHDNYMVKLRIGNGQFAHDPLSNYRHPIPIPCK